MSLIQATSNFRNQRNKTHRTFVPDGSTTIVQLVFVYSAETSLLSIYVAKNNKNKNTGKSYFGVGFPHLTKPFQNV